jgi:3-hydroxybutyryl-CoA dehydrogenase
MESYPASAITENQPIESLPSLAIQSVAVIGAGQMGHGIAQVMANEGQRSVYLFDAHEAALSTGMAGIESSLARFVKKDKLSSAQMQEVLSRISPEKTLTALAHVDLVIEAIVESEPVKIALFRQLDAVVQPNAILASNTSSISITRLAAATQRPQQVVGMHFMNPVPLMKLVEIIKGAQTSESTYQAIASLTAQLGKTGVLSKDFPGFIANRVLMPLVNEAIFALYEGIASAKDIDTVMTLGMNHPMGPLTLADFIGLDTCLSIMTVLMDGFQDARFRPCPLLRQYVDAGYLGRKSGRGFFDYSN